MPFHASVGRERIMAFGGAGAGKTRAIMSVADLLHKTKSEAKVRIIDTDFTVERMLEGYPHLHPANGGNVEFTEVTDFEEFDKAAALYFAKAKPIDWTVIDLVSPLWDMAQEWYVNRMFKKDMDEFFLQAREQNKKGNPLDGFKDWCVDSETEILTRLGWKTYDQVVDGDEVMVLREDGTSAWEPVIGLYVGQERRRNMVAMEGLSHSSFTTTEHRWLVERAGKMEWTTSGEFPADARIPHRAAYTGAPTEAKHTDAMVELVGWYWTEGWRNGTALQGGIGQSEKANPEKVARIRRALTGVFGPAGAGRGSAWNESVRPDGVVTFRLNKTAMQALLELVDGFDKVPTWEFLHSLTLAQVGLLVDVALAGDGSVRARGQRTFYQASARGRDLFMVAALMAGHGVRAWEGRSKRDGEGRFGDLPHRVSVLSSAGVWPAMANRLAAKLGSPSASRINVVYDGMVWCPMTPSGTWLARRRGTVYFTGNSIINRAYKTKVANRILRAAGNVYVTSSAKSVASDLDSPETKALFGPWGVKPVGQKHDPHLFHTVLLMKQDRDGWKMTTVKDREREYQVNVPVANFATGYLVKVAKWSMT